MKTAVTSSANRPATTTAIRTRPYRILVGHSRGGLFAVDTFVEQPELFNAYVAISPSLWWENMALIVGRAA